MAEPRGEIDSIAVEASRHASPTSLALGLIRMKLVRILATFVLLWQVGCSEHAPDLTMAQAQWSSSGDKAASHKSLQVAASPGNSTRRVNVYVTDAKALAHLMRVTDRVTPWIELPHPGTTLAAVANPQQRYFESWLARVACMKLAELRCDLNAEHDDGTHPELCSGGGHIVLIARIGPNYAWRMPAWDRAHYQAVRKHAEEQKARLEKSWDVVEIAIDTELSGDMRRETFPPDYFAGLERYDYYLPVLEHKPDPLQQPHLWLQYVVGPVERARQIVPCYHASQQCPPGYMQQRNFGEPYGHPDLEKFLAYRNALLYFAPQDEVAMCQEIARQLR